MEVGYGSTEYLVVFLSGPFSTSFKKAAGFLWYHYPVYATTTLR